MASTSTAKKPDPNAVYVASQGHHGPFGTFPRGTRLRASHPAVVAYPDLFVPDGLPADEMPNEFTAINAAHEQREREEREAREALFEKQARANPVKLMVELVRCTADHLGVYQGQPALIKKGSLVVASDIVAEQRPELWKAA